MADSPGRLFIVTGPSCVGKTPLFHTLQRLRPDVAQPLQPVVLYNDREPRPGERDGVDYHFRSTDRIEALREEPGRYIVLAARDDLQALDIAELTDGLDAGPMLFEGNPFVGKLLATDERLKHIDRRSMFISPLSGQELVALADAGADPAEAVVTVMRRKLTRRARAQHGELTETIQADIQTRAGSAHGELKLARHFDMVVANHDGEDSEHWTLLDRPIGDARRTLAALVAMLEGRQPDNAERWSADWPQL